MSVIIRPIEENDAESLWQMMSALDSETKYMMYEPNERTKNIDRIKSAINDAAIGDKTVMCINDAAKHLYEKNGFAVEGIKKNSMIVDGTYADEYYMAKLL